MRNLSVLCTFLLALALAGCGGGGGSSAGGAAAPPPTGVTDSTPPAPPGPSSAPLATLANVCTDDGQKTWVRAHLDDVYLWYQDIINVYPANFASAQEYFTALLVPSKDRFSFSEDQATIDQSLNAGQSIGYGATYAIDTGNRLRVEFTEPGSPAAVAGMVRGTEVVGINGVPRLQLDTATRSAALYPTAVGVSNTFDVLDPGATASRKVTLVSMSVLGEPVQGTNIVMINQRRYGYVTFNAHNAISELQIEAAMRYFQLSGIDELVLDLRYNGGGYLFIAQEVGSMIAGVAPQGQVFERLQFNDKHPEKTNDPGYTERFSATDSIGHLLPHLGLKRVFVLTSAGTCSASESIINGLAPFVQVITVGGTTCGKPYGFIQTNNCSIGYFAIQFAGVNAQGNGAYVNGFTPTCAADDDLDHPLGDPHERLFSTAVNYATAGSCPVNPQVLAQSRARAAGASEVKPQVPWLNNRLLRGAR